MKYTGTFVHINKNNNQKKTSLPGEYGRISKMESKKKLWGNHENIVSLNLMISINNFIVKTIDTFFNW